MKNKKKVFFVWGSVFILLLFSGCSQTENKGSVYYLNFKPEVAEIWQEVAEIYEKETGVEVKVLTAGGGTYERTLQSEMAKKNGPTLFQMNGPNGYQTWSDYCLDLKDTELYSWLLDKTLAVEDGDGVYGIPYVVEGYGIIYNESIMQKYFSLSEKQVSISSTDEINNFETLKAVVEDMTRLKEKLGIKGVFGSTSLASGEEWRWQTHLANVAVYYEFEDKGVTDTDHLDFTYNLNFKNIFDLYTNNSITEKSLLTNKTVADSMEEFAKGEVAMVQNGNWAWSQISEVEGNIVDEKDIKFLPIYTGVEGEEKQGLCIGTENYFGVSSWASEEDQKATIDFVEWLFSSDVGKDYITNRFGFISPFDTFSDEEKPSDPLAKQVVESMENQELTSVNWNFTAFPNQSTSKSFKDVFADDLVAYLKQEKEWSELVSDVTTKWSEDKAN